jgi:hypothetical protein
MSDKGTLPAELRTNRFRDRFVCVVCNFLLRHVASEWYRAMIDRSIRLGLRTAAEEASRESRRSVTGSLPGRVCVTDGAE